MGRGMAQAWGWHEGVALGSGGPGASVQGSQPLRVQPVGAEQARSWSGCEETPAFSPLGASGLRRLFLRWRRRPSPPGIPRPPLLPPAGLRPGCPLLCALPLAPRGFSEWVSSFPLQGPAW